MELKFKNEWPLLSETARANRLSVPETILLFAIREAENGKKGNEFNMNQVQNSSLPVQADSMAYKIQKGEYLYQKYLLGKFPGLELQAGDTPIEFIDFFTYHLMPNEGNHRDKEWVDNVKKYRDFIDNYFTEGE